MYWTEADSSQEDALTSTGDSTVQWQTSCAVCQYRSMPHLLSFPFFSLYHYYSLLLAHKLIWREASHTHAHTHMLTHTCSHPGLRRLRPLLCWSLPRGPAGRSYSSETMCLQDGPVWVRDEGPTVLLKGSYCPAPPPSGTINYGPPSSLVRRSPTYTCPHKHMARLRPSTPFKGWHYSVCCEWQ